MPFSSRLMMGRSSRDRKESLLMKPNASVRTNGSGHYHHGSIHHSDSTSSGSDAPYEQAKMINTTRSSNFTASDSRQKSDNRCVPQYPPVVKEEIPATESVMQFVPAFDEQDTSWDAILNEGAAAFPQSRRTGAKSEVAGLSGTTSRFRRKALSTVGDPLQQQKQQQQHHSQSQQPQRPKVAESRSSSRSKVARLASLFSSRDSKTAPVKPFTSNKKASPQNTTDYTLPSSPSRSSSSGGYVNWPNTLDKRGEPVVVQSSYEENEIQQNHRHGLPVDVAVYEDLQAQQEMQEWMESPAFQDISGVTPDPTGEKADDSVYFEEEHKEEPPLHLEHNCSRNPSRNHSFSNQRNGWREGDSHATSPSRSIRSKTSSAYFDNDVRPMAFPTFGESGDPRRKQAAAGVMRRVDPNAPIVPQAPTEEALAINNSLSPPHRTFHADTARGYRGLLDPSQEVPNLMDGADSDSLSSSRASSAVPSNATGPAPNNQSSKSMGLSMPRVHEEDMLRDCDSDVFDEISKYSIEQSELFDGISQSDSKTTSNYEVREALPYNSGRDQSVMEKSKATLREMRNTAPSVERRHQPQNQDTQSRTKPAARGDMKVVLLGGGLTTIQTTTDSFSNRITATDFDECLTNSDIDEYGGTKLPSFREMTAAGRGVNDSASIVDHSVSVDQSGASKDETDLSFTTFGHEFQKYDVCTSPVNNTNATNVSTESSYRDDESAFFSDFYSGDEVEFEGDLSKYYVQPSSVKALVRKYRKMCRSTLSNCTNYDDLDKAEDEKKIFALSEMRSRVMEKDIERGLERRGGTSVVDDIVTTPYYRKAMRIRDAVIVSKAWRDGASPMDVINTAHLTQRTEQSYFIKRPIWKADPHSRNAFNDPSWHADFDMQQCSWEEVTWVDDTDFMQYSCPSLGPRRLRGTEMFTIGDCQSILLKLTNESCMELRADLNEAMAIQIQAEDLMKDEGDYGDGMMTESEMMYLTSMEEVKTISRQLVIAEKAFALVRDRVRKLVATYEKLLVKIDNEDMATSSVVTADSSVYSAYSSRVSADYDREDRAWYRRQQRAELSAELAAREALLAKQSQARSTQEEKHRELQAIQARLAELKSEASTAVVDRQRSAILAKAIASRNQDHSERQGQGQQNQSGEGFNSNQSTVDATKQRFRDRMAARLRRDAPPNATERRSSSHELPDQAAPHNAYLMRETPKPVKKTTPDFDRQKLIRSAGEEMFQHLDFYERSLQAVENQREGAM